MGWPLASKSSVLPAALYLLPPPLARILQQLFKIKRRETPQTLVDTCSEVLICTAVKEDVFQSFICQVLTVVEEYRSVSSEIHLRGKMIFYLL